MNYIKELNAFYDWLESNPCPSDAIALWHALVAVCNKAGWPKEFTVANSTLQAKAGLSRVKLDRWRGFLKDKGLIQYEKSKKVNEAGRYSLIPFVPIVQNDTRNDTQGDTRNDTQDVTQNDTQDETQNEHIIKTKLNENETKGDYPLKSPKGERSRFTPPTLEEVISYCEERQNNVDAAKWYDFYASKGWMVGRNKMKDWKAAVRTWERGEQSSFKPQRKETSFDVLQRMIRESEGHGSRGRVEVNHDLFG